MLCEKKDKKVSWHGKVVCVSVCAAGVKRTSVASNLGFCSHREERKRKICVCVCVCVFVFSLALSMFHSHDILVTLCVCVLFSTLPRFTRTKQLLSSISRNVAALILCLLSHSHQCDHPIPFLFLLLRKFRTLNKSIS
jgi:hypothetical protein